MAQLNLYVPDDLASRLRKEARRAGLPLSRYVLTLIAQPAKSAWPGGFFDKTCGFLKGDFPEPPDRLPEAVELADSES